MKAKIKQKSSNDLKKDGESEWIGSKRKNYKNDVNHNESAIAFAAPPTTEKSGWKVKN